MAVDGNLTQRQRRFVAAYVDCLEPREAALAAGYKPRGAARLGERLLTRRPVVEAIARLARDDVAERDGASLSPDSGAPITRAWITKELTELYGTVKACVTTPGESGGKAPSAASLQGVIRTFELLIKHLEVEGPCESESGGEPEPDLSRLTHDELRQLEAILARAQPEPGPE